MKKFFSQHEAYALLVIILLSIVITLIKPSFFTLENLLDLLKSYSYLGIFAIGILFVLISGGIDISFSATATVAMYAMAVFLLRDESNIFLAFIIPAAIGILLGPINACIIYFLTFPALSPRLPH